jgi:hypothetical protein
MANQEERIVTTDMSGQHGTQVSTASPTEPLSGGATIASEMPTEGERDAEIAEVVDRIAGYWGAHRSGYWGRVADRLRRTRDDAVPARAHYEEVE